MRIECENLGCDCEAKYLCPGCHMVYCLDCAERDTHSCSEIGAV